MAMAKSTVYSTVFSDLSTQTIAVFLVVFLTLYFFVKRRKNLPPSPGWSWPVVGHLLSLGRAPHLKLTEWRKQYGDVYTVRMGMEDVVVLNGYRAIKEAFVDYKDAFSSRPDIVTLDVVTGFGQTIVTSRFSKTYKEKRKFAVRALRTLGMKTGPGSIEEHIREEARQLCDKLSEQEGSYPRDITNNLVVSVGNIICSMAFGKHHGPDDEELLELTTSVIKLATLLGASQPLTVFPFLRFIPGVNSSYKKIVVLGKKITAFARQEITKRRENFDSENPRDFIDLLLVGLKSQDGTRCITEENIAWMLEDLFLAGFETPTSTLRWGLLYMVLWPEEQKKVQAELDSVLGKDHSVPTLAHRPQLPYTEATIMEVMRIRAIAAINIPHATTEDTNFRGYDIPAGTQVLANIWSAHMDPEYWPDPEKFDPRRFLGPDGSVVSRPDSFLPFAVGRRKCLGEQLAKMELFLIFSSLLKHFTFKLPEGAATPSTDGHLGITLSPPTVPMCIAQR